MAPFLLNRKPLKGLLASLYLLVCLVLSAQESREELILKAYQYTYPGRIRRVFRSDGDWTIQAGEEIFYWAEGRLLPAALRYRWQDYQPYGFSVYPEQIPDPKDYNPVQIELLRLQGGAEARLEGVDHHYGFQAALYGGMTRFEIEGTLTRIRFLDREAIVHRDITEALARIDRKIREIAAEDGETRAFIAAINSVDGYNWREIRGTRRMSYHSWGLAVDIQPKALNNRTIYWLWERTHNQDWMLVPPGQRWQPPDAVIRTFEHEGFIWGGKWALYDNMHFEFRPELHEINRLLAAETGAVRISKSPDAPDLHHLFPRGLLGEKPLSLKEKITKLLVPRKD
jgi:hypothetical protein